MGVNNRPLPTKCFIRYLIEQGLTKSRTTASHDLWTRKGLIRSVVIREKDKEIPSLHLKTNCKTLGVNLKSLYDWADANC